MSSEVLTGHPSSNNPGSRRWMYTLLLSIILIAGGYLRLRGLYWGEYQYLHPDERFLVMVGSSISTVESLSEYWNTAVSSLNPHNVGHDLYVYGTLPMFLTRYLVGWIYGHSGLEEMTNIGRALSALFDLSTVYLVYLVARQLYDRRVGLLAAAFSAFAVLQIQQSHFFTMDTFVTFFALLTVYFAVRIAQANVANEGSKGEGVRDEAIDQPDLQPERQPFRNPEFGTSTDRFQRAASNPDYALRITNYELSPADRVERRPAQDSPSTFHASRFTHHVSRFASHPLFILSLGFAISLGMAAASKINAAPLALLLPVAMLVAVYGLPAREQIQRTRQMVPYLGLAAVISFLVFRILQPYAFAGPGFFGLLPNPMWLENLRRLQGLVSGDIGFPPNVQWVNRPVWFSWQNMVMWGMGLPLGLLAWAGFLWAGWRMLHSWRNGELEWQRHILLWGWTGFYFVWQSLPNNPTMRYQLPVYPTLAIFAAWAVIALWDRWGGQGLSLKVGRLAALTLGAGVLVATGIYALGFSSIYTRPITRIEASRWVYQNIAGPINFQIRTPGGPYNQPLSFPRDYSITAGHPYTASFTAKASGVLDQVYLHEVVVLESGSQLQA
ncbi:MAG TPA: glycosyltransferase family 39 protein, partial [Anaerolineales bacterium]